MAKTGRPTTDPYLRFAQKIQLDEATGCWMWTGRIGPTGYGIFTMNGSKNFLAHRASYELFIGQIPPKHDVHHACKCRLCCNPHHLSPLDRKSHSLVHSSEKTECDNGHPYVEGSFIMVMDHGYPTRRCLICRRLNAARQSERRKRLRAANPRPNANAAKTHCPYGHEYNEENTGYDKNGGRICLACRKIHNQSRPHKEPKQFCKWNHAKTPENTYTHQSGKTECKPCMMRRLHEYRERKRLNGNTIQKSGPESGQPSGPDMTKTT